MQKLTNKAIEHAKPGKLSDGNGLILLVRHSGGKHWILRIQVDGKRQDIGLGSYRQSSGLSGVTDEIELLERRFLTLAEARLKAATLRQLAKAGRCPLTELRRDRSPIPDFATAMQKTYEARLDEWSDITAAAFLSSLEQHAIPTLGKRRVNEIDAPTIADVLKPIWIAKPLISRKVRQRINLVLNYSQAQKWRDMPAPNEALSLLLPKQPATGNMEAMAYADVPKFVAGLGEGDSPGRLALLFLIATAARSGEVRGARWSQIDRLTSLWKRPAALMKGRNSVAHSVTLNRQALAILDVAAANRRNDDDLIFPAQRGGQLSDAALAVFLRGRVGTAHGFRSSFRDWAAEQRPEIPDPVAEAALAHKVSDKVVGAYKRTDFVDMRRGLLDGWGDFAFGQCERYG